MKAVDVLRVEKVRPSDGIGQGVFIPRYRDDVDVIGHQAIALDRKAEPIGLRLEQFEIEPAVVVGEKDVLTVVAALCDVVRQTGKHNPGESRHRLNLTKLSPRVNK